jgi:hypothetical protein
VFAVSHKPVRGDHSLASDSGQSTLATPPAD